MDFRVASWHWQVAHGAAGCLLGPTPSLWTQTRLASLCLLNPSCTEGCSCCAQTLRAGRGALPTLTSHVPHPAVQKSPSVAGGYVPAMPWFSSINIITWYLNSVPPKCWVVGVFFFISRLQQTMTEYCVRLLCCDHLQLKCSSGSITSSVHTRRFFSRCRWTFLMPVYAAVDRRCDFPHALLGPACWLLVSAVTL